MKPRSIANINEVRDFIALTATCESQMQIQVCNGCDHCGLRCAAGVPAAQHEWDTLKEFISSRSETELAEIQRVEAQDKTVDLGDDVTVQMCRFRDMELGRCIVYRARPLICRLLGHVEWLPCPIEAVASIIPTSEAIPLMVSYADFERHTFEEWVELDRR